MVIVILVLSAAVAVCTGFYDGHDIMPDRTSKNLNHGPPLQYHILERQDAAIEDFPYILSVRVGPKFTQSAVIISPNWALTIASSLNTTDASSITIRGGSSFKESGGQEHSVNRVVVHPQFKTGSSEYNFVLLELESPLVLNEQVKPVGLPKQGYEVPEFTKANTSGWGSLNADPNDYSINLKKQKVQTVRKSWCEHLDSGSITYSPRLLCAEIMCDRTKPCAGDQGGPLVIDGQLIGLVVTDKCGFRSPHSTIFANWYAKVADQRAWIDSVIGFEDIPNGPIA